MIPELPDSHTPDDLILQHLNTMDDTRLLAMVSTQDDLSSSVLEGIFTMISNIPKGIRDSTMRAMLVAHIARSQHCEDALLSLIVEQIFKEASDKEEFSELLYAPLLFVVKNENCSRSLLDRLEKIAVNNYQKRLSKQSDQNSTGFFALLLSLIVERGFAYNNPTIQDYYRNCAVQWIARRKFTKESFSNSLNPHHTVYAEYFEKTLQQATTKQLRKVICKEDRTYGSNFAWLLRTDAFQMVNDSVKIDAINLYLREEPMAIDIVLSDQTLFKKMNCSFHTLHILLIQVAEQVLTKPEHCTHEITGLLNGIAQSFKEKNTVNTNSEFLTLIKLFQGSGDRRLGHWIDWTLMNDSTLFSNFTEKEIEEIFLLTTPNIFDVLEKRSSGCFVYGMGTPLPLVVALFCKLSSSALLTIYTTWLDRKDACSYVSKLLSGNSWLPKFTPKDLSNLMMVCIQKNPWSVGCALFGHSKPIQIRGLNKLEENWSSEKSIVINVEPNLELQRCINLYSPEDKAEIIKTCLVGLMTDSESRGNVYEMAKNIVNYVTTSNSPLIIPPGMLTFILDEVIKEARKLELHTLQKKLFELTDVLKSTGSTPKIQSQSHGP